MSSRMREMFQFCRFCLSRSDLNYLTKAKEFSFTTQDIEHYTGIRISEEEKSASAICDQCYSVLEKSIAFRKACLRNDILFKQLLTAHSESLEETIEISDDFVDTASFEIEKDETQKLLITSDVGGGMLNNEEEKDETQRLLITSDEDVGILNIEEEKDETQKLLITSDVNEGVLNIEEENNETQWLLITSDEDEGILNIEEEKDETQKLFETSDVEEGMLNTEDHSKAGSTDEDEKKTNIIEDEVQVKPKKIKRKLQLCSVCGKLVKNLNGHNQNHIKEKKYSCSHCQLKMSSRTNMKRHIEAVHEKKIIVCCDQCGKGFTHKYTYTSHMMVQHGIGETFECMGCSKTFNTPKKHREHMIKWHTLQEEVSCTICQMKFRSNKQLVIHQRVHSSDQPFACDHCPKRFKSPYARKIHMVAHSGVRFPCTLCGKSYSYKSLLNMHLRKDHHVKPSHATDIKNEDDDSILSKM